LATPHNTLKVWMTKLLCHVTAEAHATYRLNHSVRTCRHDEPHTRHEEQQRIICLQSTVKRSKHPMVSKHGAVCHLYMFHGQNKPARCGTGKPCVLANHPQLTCLRRPTAQERSSNHHGYVGGVVACGGLDDVFCLFLAFLFSTTMRCRRAKPYCSCSGMSTPKNRRYASL